MNVINQYSATGDNSTIYLGDYNSGRVYEYSSAGTLLGSFDTHLGAGLIAGSYDFSNISMWVTDTNTDRAYDMTTAGVTLSSFAAAGSPFGVAIVPPSVTPEPSFGPLLLVGLAVSVYSMKLHRRNRRHSASC